MPTSRRDTAGIRQRGAEVVAPYAKRDAESPGIGSRIGVICRVVEDADPYEGMRRAAVGADSIRPRSSVPKYEKREANSIPPHVYFLFFFFFWLSRSLRLIS